MRVRSPLCLLLVLVAALTALAASASPATGARVKAQSAARFLVGRHHRSPHLILCEVRSLVLLRPSCGGTSTNYSAVVAYANKWAGSYICTTKTNCPSDTSSDVGYNPEYWDFGNDCTNFVSQALRAGGWADSSAYSQWWYSDEDPNGEDYPLDGWSSSWPVSTDLYTFAVDSGRGWFVNKNAARGNVNWSMVVPGDIIFVDWDSTNDSSTGYQNINHVMIVTSTSGVAQGSVYLGDILIAQHTTNRKNYHISNDTAEFPNARWWVMEP